MSTSKTTSIEDSINRMLEAIFFGKGEEPLAANDSLDRFQIYIHHMRDWTYARITNV